MLFIFCIDKPCHFNYAITYTTNRLCAPFDSSTNCFSCKPCTWLWLAQTHSPTVCRCHVSGATYSQVTVGLNKIMRTLILRQTTWSEFVWIRWRAAPTFKLNLKMKRLQQTEDRVGDTLVSWPNDWLHVTEVNSETHSVSHGPTNTVYLGFGSTTPFLEFVMLPLPVIVCHTG